MIREICIYFLVICEPTTFAGMIFYFFGDFSVINALVIGFPEGGDPGLMGGNTGTLWVLCNKFLPLWWGKCGDLDF